MNNEEMKMHSIFRGSPESADLWDRIKFEFERTVVCDQIKIEFDELTFSKGYADNEYRVFCGNIIFISQFSTIQTPVSTPIATPEKE